MAILSLNEQSLLLEAAAESLDIDPRLYEEAILKYEDIGTWLAHADSDLREHTPNIFPQGSFRLGTMVRSICPNHDHDIDLVCRLSIGKNNVSKAELKKMIGDQLKKRADLREILSESRRAWTLEYRRQFHLDVLSTIPNVERPPSGILLPDKGFQLWQKSDPIAYAEWFYDRMRVIYRKKQAALAEELQANIEEVPYWQVRTPLQRVVQILKRHRDLYFQKDLENRPVSIIITTLAALAYRNQPDIFEALIDCLKTLSNYIEKRGAKWWVKNPVEPDENFAERWNEYPERQEAFFKWLDQANEDFTEAARQTGISKIAAALSPSLGRLTVNKAAASLGVEMQPLMESNRAAPEDYVPVLTYASHAKMPLWPMAITHTASVTASVYRTKYGSKKLWDLTNRSVPKGVGLRFRVATNVRPPYEVRWQVVNTGREATDARDQRGGFEKSEDGMRDVHWESTAYAGTHWVEAFIIKGFSCVARSGKKLVRVRG